MEIKPDNKGLIVAELINKITRKTKNDETFYVLEISLRKTITEMVLELRKETNSISLNSKEPFYVFANRGKGNKYAYTLETGCLYAFWFTKFSNPQAQEDYFHVLDWRKLAADKRSIERTLRLVLNKKEEETEEETITNRELLTDLKRRIKAGKISLKISAVKSDDYTPLEIDTDLKDNESNFTINLQKEKD
jgi:hypothetical protein